MPLGVRWHAYGGCASCRSTAHISTAMATGSSDTRKSFSESARARPASLVSLSVVADRQVLELLVANAIRLQDNDGVSILAKAQPGFGRLLHVASQQEAWRLSRVSAPLALSWEQGELAWLTRHQRPEIHWV